LDNRRSLSEPDWIAATTERLAELYDCRFGGNNGGRYRISSKLMRRAAGRRRLYDEDKRLLSRPLFEHGFVLIDMDGIFVVIRANAFVNYRRANDECFE